MNLSRLVTSAMRATNRPVLALLGSRPWGRRAGHAMTTVSYVGRRSGRRISLPVVYRRRGDRVTIIVLLADDKTWWRNFLGDGAPITLQLDGVEHTGHAVAHRNEHGRVRVSVQL